MCLDTFLICLDTLFQIYSLWIISRLALGEYFLIVLVTISLIKLLSYFLLMEYRERVKGNLRNVVIVGKNKKTDQLQKVFNERREFGYNFLKQFSPKETGFDIHNCFDYICIQCLGTL